MCWFITLGVKRAAVAELEKLTHNRTGLAVWPVSNRHVAALFPKDDSLYFITTGMCSCSLMPRIDLHASQQLEKRREWYRKQGWSEVKIARAIESTEAALKAKRRHENDLAPERGFREAITDQVRHFGGIRLFAHFYSGDVADEQVMCNGRRQMTLDEFLDQGLPGDVLVEMVASNG